MKDEVWIDEKGKNVKIIAFFSSVYIDEELDMLSSKYCLWNNCDGERRSSTLGKTEKEGLAAQILSLVRSACLNPPRLVGVKKSELENAASKGSYHWYIPEFVKEGLLREKWVKGSVVVFPTEKLLKNQGIPVFKS